MSDELPEGECSTKQLIAATIDGERERCAQVCKAIAGELITHGRDPAVAERCCAAIRRGTP